MHCRYCSAAYEDGATACARCGAAKIALKEKLLDAQASPAHWSRSLRAAMLRLGLGAAALMLLMRVFDVDDANLLAQFALIFWVICAAPLLLIYASWRSAAKGAGGARLLLILRNLALSLVFWLIGTMLLVWALDPMVYAEPMDVIETPDENATKFTR